VLALDISQSCMIAGEPLTWMGTSASARQARTIHGLAPSGLTR
jgi:hypothetical protein